MSETWMFQTEAGRDNAKESLSLRHPSNFTKWIDDYTVELSGDVHYQTGVLLKGHGAKKIDG